MPSLRMVGRHEQAGRASLTTRPPITIDAGVVALQPRDHAQGRGLAAARRAEQRDELAVLDDEVDAVDRLHLAEVPADARAG